MNSTTQSLLCTWFTHDILLRDNSQSAPHTVSRDGTQRSVRHYSILSSAGVHVFELNVMQLV